MLGADVLGFQAEQWAENFLLGARDTLRDARVDVRRRRVDFEGPHRARARLPGLAGPRPRSARRRATPEVKAIRGELAELAGRREASAWCVSIGSICRRTSCAGSRPSESFLDEHPEWHERVTVPRAAASVAFGDRRVPAPTASGASRGRRPINDKFGTADLDAGARCAPTRTTRRRSPPTASTTLVREPDLRRDEPRRDGGSARQPAAGRAHPVAQRRRVRAARAARDRGEPVRCGARPRRRSRRPWRCPSDERVRRAAAWCARSWRATRCAGSRRSCGTSTRSRGDARLTGPAGARGALGAPRR